MQRAEAKIWTVDETRAMQGLPPEMPAEKASRETAHERSKIEAEAQARVATRERAAKEIADLRANAERRAPVIKAMETIANAKDAEWFGNAIVGIADKLKKLSPGEQMVLEMKYKQFRGQADASLKNTPDYQAVSAFIKKREFGQGRIWTPEELKAAENDEDTMDTDASSKPSDQAEPKTFMQNVADVPDSMRRILGNFLRDNRKGKSGK